MLVGRIEPYTFEFTVAVLVHGLHLERNGKRNIRAGPRVTLDPVKFEFTKVDGEGFSVARRNVPVEPSALHAGGAVLERSKERGG